MYMCTYSTAHGVAKAHDSRWPLHGPIYIHVPYSHPPLACDYIKVRRGGVGALASAAAAAATITKRAASPLLFLLLSVPLYTHTIHIRVHIHTPVYFQRMGGSHYKNWHPGRAPCTAGSLTLQQHGALTASCCAAFNHGAMSFLFKGTWLDMQMCAS